MLKSVAKLYIIDGDPAMRQWFGALALSMQLCPKPFASPPEFLEHCTPSEPGCVLLDVRPPGVSALELLDCMRRWVIPFPVIVVSVYGDVRTAVRAMRAGALFFFEKPCRQHELEEAIREAIRCDAENRRRLARKRRLHQRLAKLNTGERAVLDRVLEGIGNKEIATELGLTIRTIEARRAKIMDKMKADSLAELIRMTLEATVLGEESQPLFPR